MFQKDVNNYIIVAADGHYKTKGIAVKAWEDKKGKQLDLDYDCVIVRPRAGRIHGKRPFRLKKTISMCDDFRQFQIVRKISSKYDCIYHGGVEIKERCVRAFASKNPSDGALKKKHKAKGEYRKNREHPGKFPAGQ